MTVGALLNILTIICCVAVFVQCTRLIRRLHTMRDGSLRGMVTALDRATAAARAVLQDLRLTLVDDLSAHEEVARDATVIRDELVVLVGIGNSVAERISEAASKASEYKAEYRPPEGASTDHEEAPTS
jgi:hypothetical protein